MRVGINFKPAPRPFIGALISGIADLAGSGIDALAARKQQERQIEHDKDMAGLNQQYALEQMEQANQYQVEQWNRENEYNDPSAVRARYEAAGISPHAAFGQGSASGAGIAGGLSGAPSGSGTGHSSNIMYDTDFGGLGSSILDGILTDAQVRRAKAETDNIESDTIGKRFDNEVLAPLRSQLQTALTNKAISDANVAKIVEQWEPYMADLRSRALESDISNVDAQTQTFLSSLENDEVYRSLTKEQQNFIVQQVRESEQRVLALIANTALTKAKTSLASVEGDLMRSQKELNDALKSKEQKMLPYLDKQIELLASQMNLNSEQIAKWKAEVKQKWTEIGVNTALSTVSEVRNWVGMFMPFGKSKSNPIGFGKR